MRFIKTGQYQDGYAVTTRDHVSLWYIMYLGLGRKLTHTDVDQDERQISPYLAFSAFALTLGSLLWKDKEVEWKT